ncbi:SigE family RNA polymerase sigma factor, partial [Streptomyces goshikiensis]
MCLARAPAGRDGDRPAPAPAESAESAEKVVVAGTTVDHLTETYQAHYRSL